MLQLVNNILYRGQKLSYHNQMKKIYPFILFFSVTTRAGIIEPHTLWDKLAIKTCWYDQEDQLAQTRINSIKMAKSKFEFVPKELSKREKAKVQQAVERNFSPSRTGIHFVGWKDCSQTQAPDLIVMEAKSKIPIFSRPSFNGRAVIGEEGLFTIDEEASSTGFFGKSGLISNIALYTQNSGTVVHEFGHVAGLRHEHINSDAKEDELCHTRQVTLNFKKPNELETPHDSTLIFTEYDRESIMSYCWLQTRRKYLDKHDGVILSEKDQETLRHFYQ